MAPNKTSLHCNFIRRPQEMDEQTFNKEERAFPPPFSLRNNNMPESSGYKNARCLAHHSPPKAK
jgi:hypothetical protein